MAASRLVADANSYPAGHFQQHLFDQYKFYVDSALKVSDRRISTGNYLLTVNSSLLTMFGLIAGYSDWGSALAVIPAAGVIVTLAWISLVVSYQRLNAAKFKVIEELESHMPAAPFREEWTILLAGTGGPYQPVTQVERWVPAVFLCLHLALGAYAVDRSPKNEPRTPVRVEGHLEIAPRGTLVIEQSPAPRSETTPRRP